MRLRWAALMMTLLLTLTGCGANENTPDMKARESYAGLTGFNATAQITADYGEKVYQYEAILTGDLTSGRLEVTAPETIAGTCFQWKDGEGAACYGDVTLETGSLSPDGLSPVDAMSCVLNALAAGKQLSTCEEKLDGERTLFLELSNPSYPEGTSNVLAWLSPEDFSLRRCEITWEGTGVIVCSFAEFTYTTQMQTTEG